MPANISDHQKSQFISEEIQRTLDNFGLCSKVAAFLREEPKLPGCVVAEVKLFSVSRRPETIRGICGFFTTPVIQMALIDARKSLGFFGVAVDPKTQKLDSQKNSRPDDLDLRSFGLPLVSPSEFFLGVRNAGSPSTIEPALARASSWANKRLAHFTAELPDVTFDDLELIAFTMIAAYKEMFFRPLKISFPVVQGFEKPA